MNEIRGNNILLNRGFTGKESANGWVEGKIYWTP